MLPIAARDRDKSIVLPEGQDAAPLLKSPPHPSRTVYCGSNKDLKSGESMPPIARSSFVPNPTASVPSCDGPCKLY